MTREVFDPVQNGKIADTPVVDGGPAGEITPERGIVEIQREREQRAPRRDEGNEDE